MINRTDQLRRVKRLCHSNFRHPVLDPLFPFPYVKCNEPVIRIPWEGETNIDPAKRTPVYILIANVFINIVNKVDIIKMNRCLGG